MASDESAGTERDDVWWLSRLLRESNDGCGHFYNHMREKRQALKAGLEALKRVAEFEREVAELKSEVEKWEDNAERKLARIRKMKETIERVRRLERGWDDILHFPSRMDLREALGDG